MVEKFKISNTGFQVLIIELLFFIAFIQHGSTLNKH